MIRIAALMALVALLPASGCGMPEGKYFGKVDKDPDPTHFRWCNSGEPEYIDPALSTSTTGIPLVYSLWTGLAGNKQSGLPYLTAATSFEASPDKRRFVFKLRKDAVWSNGRPLTAHDFVYQAVRVLHPLTASRNAETLWRLKNGQLFTQNRVRMVLDDVGPFKKGDIVEVLGRDGDVADDPSTLSLPNPNVRTSRSPLLLRDLGADESEAYFTVPAGAEVTIIELGGDNDSWAYVFYGGVQDGKYGWVRAEKLTGQPNGDVMFTVRAVPPEHIPGVTLPPAPDVPRTQGTVAGKHLLMLPEVLGIRAEDDYTLVLEGWAPIHIILDLVADRALRPSPREAVSRWPKEWSRPEHIVTSGPLHLVEWKIRDKVVMVKSDTYWDQDVVKTEKFTVYSLNDQAASANLYMTGRCDAVATLNIPASYLPVLNGEKRGGKAYADYGAEPYLGIYMYLVNVDRFPNVHFRRALSLAIDRTPFPFILHGGQTPAAQFVPGTPISDLTAKQRALCGVTADQRGVALIIKENELCYVPPEGLWFDPEAAKKELALAKKEMGADFPQSFTVRFNSGSEGHKLVAEYLQYEWKEVLGLDVALESQEWKTFLKSTADGDYDIARMGWIGSYASAEDFIKLGKCGSPNNRTNFCDPEFEKVFELAMRESDRKKRLEYLREAESILLQKAPILPFYVYSQYYLKKPYVRDLAQNLFNRPGLFRAWIDPDWEEHAAETEGEN